MQIPFFKKYWNMLPQTRSKVQRPDTLLNHSFSYEAKWRNTDNEIVQGHKIMSYWPKNIVFEFICIDKHLASRKGGKSSNDGPLFRTLGSWTLTIHKPEYIYRFFSYWNLFISDLFFNVLSCVKSTFRYWYHLKIYRYDI